MISYFPFDLFVEQLALQSTMQLQSNSNYFDDRVTAVNDIESHIVELVKKSLNRSDINLLLKILFNSPKYTLLRFTNGY